MPTALDPAQARAMMLLVAERIIAAESLLSQADRDLGDGDHGLGMKRGMEAVQAKLQPMEPADLEQVFKTSGMAMLSSMGGASGAIFGTVFIAGGKALTGQSAFDSAALATLLEAANEGVMKRGGAKVGDKTMIDALAPAAAAARASSSLPLPEAIAATADAADTGKENSKDMIAVFGRAKTLGEAARGFPDAGALSVTIILSAMREYITSLK